MYTLRVVLTAVLEEAHACLADIVEQALGRDSQGVVGVDDRRGVAGEGQDPRIVEVVIDDKAWEVGGGKVGEGGDGHPREK